MQYLFFACLMAMMFFNSAAQRNGTSCALRNGTCTLLDCRFSAFLAEADLGCPPATPVCCVPRNQTASPNCSATMDAIHGDEIATALDAFSRIETFPEEYFSLEACCNSRKLLGFMQGSPLLFVLLKLFFFTPLTTVVVFLVKRIQTPLLNLMLCGSPLLKAKLASFLEAQVQKSDFLSCLVAAESFVQFDVTPSLEMLAGLSERKEKLMHSYPELYKDNRALLLHILKSSGWSGTHGFLPAQLSDELRCDEEILLLLADQAKHLLRDSGNDWLASNRAFVLMALRKDGSLLPKLSAFVGDKEAVLVAVASCGLMLKESTSMLRDDDEVVAAAIGQDPMSIEFASSRLQGDRALVLSAAKKCGSILPKISDAFRDDDEIVMEAVSRDGNSLKYASDRLKRDRSIVLAAVSHNGHALRSAAPECLDDENIVRTASQATAAAFNLASDRLKDDRNFVLSLLPINPHCISYASERVQSDVELNWIALRKDPEVFLSLHKSCRLNREMASVAVAANGDLLRFLSDELKRDKEIVFKAVQQSWQSIRYVPEDLIDEPVASCALTQDARAAQYIPKNVLQSIKEAQRLSTKRDDVPAAWGDNDSQATVSADAKNDNVSVCTSIAEMSSAQEGEPSCIERAIIAIGEPMFHVVFPFQAFLRLVVWKIENIERYLNVASTIVAFFGTSVSLAVATFTDPWLPNTGGYRVNALAIILANGSFLACLAQLFTTEVLCVRTPLAQTALQPRPVWLMPKWYEWSFVACTFLLIPILIFYWLPGLVVFLPWVVALYLSFFLILAVIGKFMSRMEALHAFDPHALLDKFDPSTTVMAFAASFLFRGGITFFLLLFLQLPINWAVMLYNDPSYVATSSRYPFVVVDEWNSRGMTCSVLESLKGPMTGLAFFLNLL